MSTPPPVPPDMPEIPPVPGAFPAPPAVPEQSYQPVPPAPAPPMPPAYPSGPAAVSYPPVGSPQATPGSGTRGLIYGCLGLLAIAGIIAVIGGIWVYKKGKEIVDNPEQFMAELAVKANPDLELVSVDKTAREVVIKDKTSGESTTFSFDDVKNGKIGLKKSDGSSAVMGPDGIRVKDKDGTESVIGGGAKVPLPEWVPAYPGTSTVVMSSQKVKGLNQTGQSAFQTPDPIDTAAATYLKVLEAGGFEVAQETTTANGGKVVSLEATAALEGGGLERVAVRFFTQGKETMIHLEYSHEEPDAGGAVEK